MLMGIRRFPDLVDESRNFLGLLMLDASEKEEEWNYIAVPAYEALKPCIAGTYRVQNFAHKHNLTNWLHALIWLLKTYAIPAG
eukprot:1142734-Pelagomonas_calceolata.AAC.8